MNVDPVTTDETQTNEVFALGDINGDGDSEIATVVMGEETVRMVVYDYQSGHLTKIYSESFTKSRRGRQHPEQIQSVSYCDLDGDGKNEILITTEDIIPNTAQDHGCFVAYRYILLTWKQEKLVELISRDSINPRVVTGDSSFLIVSAVPDRESGPYNRQI
ncbi:MAG: VCBS repeat-containing protein [Actinomycetota bacterium]|nr:VCBS repeat-containing protein [Actinomycetota bacterium]